jgi:hypothetical protein
LRGELRADRRTNVTDVPREAWKSGVNVQ